VFVCGGGAGLQKIKNLLIDLRNWIQPKDRSAFRFYLVDHDLQLCC
jgi:hypothetical protein